ncbi:MAG: double-strand break repair helicase AddA [Pseudomonadota bacterium]
MDDATRAQVLAAEPTASTWLAANAGSGKTRVLTNRVARLLLSGVAPQNILCLTYTKAAAGEMQNRLFETLGEWAMRPDPELRQALTALGENRLDGDTLVRARRLFARAIETPGGLKIQTIHSFCSALLRRFPLEAGVSPEFREMSDRSLAQLIEDVVDQIARGPDAGLLEALALQMSDEDIVGLCRDLLSQREELSRPPNDDGLRLGLGVPLSFDPSQLVADTFTPGDMERLTRLRDNLLMGSTNDTKAGAKLDALSPFETGLPLLAGLEEVLLFGKGAAAPFGPKVGKLATKKTLEKLADIAPDLDALAERVSEARALRLAWNIYQRTQVLHRFAASFLPRVEKAKQQRGWLDFDDLILKTRRLLTDPTVAQWVLYKLDGGIDHILVDEAQDTSPVQWDVVRLLAQEFTSGQSARDDRDRTIFVVGDKKQSIYSFQGADPREFDRMRGHFDDGLRAVESALHSRDLAHSFRSAPAILQAVDATFPGNSGLGTAPEHIAFKSSLPGRVDLWPVVPTSDKPKDPEGWSPVDKILPTSSKVILANHVANALDQMIREDTLPDGNGAARPIGPGDILILFRKRGGLYFEVMQALKQKGLAVAGSDRITLGTELAAQDLLALLAFLALPDDDLSLATALRSPLFGWSEDDLFRVAHHRPVGSTLWAAVRRSEDHTDTFEILDDLRNQTDYLRPYSLIDRMLTRHGGRYKLIERLGAECEEAIDGLLGQALEYERSDVPTLTGFMEWMAAEDVDIKRQTEAAGGRIRLMTVHGAKGLEAPIVVLPDCGEVRTRPGGPVMPRPGSWPAWSVKSDDRPPALDAAAEAKAKAEADERDRLLYVAMTRAEQWLIVAAEGVADGKPCWHRQVTEGLRAVAAGALETPSGRGMRHGSGVWQGVAPTAVSEQDLDVTPLPAWAHRPAPNPDRPVSPTAPSSLGGAKALPGEGLDEATALRFGRMIHALLEHLPGTPPAGWTGLAGQILDDTEPESSPAEREAAFDEATKVLTTPTLAPLFADDALAEVPIWAPMDGYDGGMGGVIDRLWISDSHVWAVDFKSNHQLPLSEDDVPEGLLRQMGAYAALLDQLYPDKSVQTALLWTRNATLMPLSRDLTRAALERARQAP